MARARGATSPESSVSLFPFLSVLACVIGTLTLLIAAIAVGQMADKMAKQEASRPEDARERANRIENLEAQITASEADLQELERLRAAVNSARQESRSAAPSPAQARALADQEKSLEAEIEALLEEREDLAAALDAVEEEFAAAMDDLEAERIRILPSGARRGIAPFFAECTAEGVRVRRPDGEWSLPLRIDDVVDGPRFKVFLDRIRRLPGGSVIFLIRPDGVDTYRAARRYVERSAVRFGKLALPGFGELDFSLFGGNGS